MMLIDCLCNRKHKIILAYENIDIFTMLYATYVRCHCRYICFSCPMFVCVLYILLSFLFTCICIISTIYSKFSTCMFITNWTLELVFKLILSLNQLDNQLSNFQTEISIMFQQARLNLFLHYHIGPWMCYF